MVVTFRFPTGLGMLTKPFLASVGPVGPVWADVSGVLWGDLLPGGGKWETIMGMHMNQPVLLSHSVWSLE